MIPLSERIERLEGHAQQMRQRRPGEVVAMDAAHFTELIDAVIEVAKLERLTRDEMWLAWMALRRQPDQASLDLATKIERWHNERVKRGVV